jgi:hypothetical protein
MSAIQYGKKLTAGEITFIKPNELQKGDTIEGKYVEVRKDQYGGNGYKFITSEGTKVLNGTGQLDSIMALVELGTNVKIVYEGTSLVKSGKFKGKEAHQFSVYPEIKNEAADL